jgi:hypothetical protein
MALDYVEIYNVMESDSTLWHKAQVAVFKAAVDVLNEASNTANHANRVIWANAVMLDPKAKMSQMKTHILMNATIQDVLSNATDNDVQFVVNGLVDTFATGS